MAILDQLECQHLQQRSKNVAVRLFQHNRSLADATIGLHSAGSGQRNRKFNDAKGSDK
jgi:hypothetical protein